MQNYIKYGLLGWALAWRVYREWNPRINCCREWILIHHYNFEFTITILIQGAQHWIKKHYNPEWRCTLTLNQFILQSWIKVYCNPESKPTSMQWMHPSSPLAKKFKASSSAGVVMLTMLCNSPRVLSPCFQKKDYHVNTALLCKVMPMHHNQTWRKCAGLQNKEPLLHYDNPRQHTS